jgi:hypothetical protein
MAGFSPPYLATGRVVAFVFSVYHSITASSHSPSASRQRGPGPPSNWGEGAPASLLRRGGKSRCSLPYVLSASTSRGRFVFDEMAARHQSGREVAVSVRSRTSLPLPVDFRRELINLRVPVREGRSAGGRRPRGGVVRDGTTPSWIRSDGRPHVDAS